MKRFFAVLLALMLLAGCVPAGAAVLTKAEQYDAALEELKAYLNDDSAILVDDLFEQFSALGSYEYSAELAIYTRVLKDIYNGEFARLPQLLAYLRMNGAFCAWLQEAGELGSVDQLEWYAKGLEAEREGKWMEAARCFEQSIPFKDSFQRSITLQENWLEERYQQAMTYYRQDTYAGYQQAYEIFQELAAYGGYKDSNNYMAMADILRATPAPTVAPTPKPTVKPTPVPTPKPLDAVTAYAEYVAAPVDTPVEVETYVQAKQSWWDNKGTFYTQNEEGAYFIYEMAISEEDYNKLVPGTKILVKGYKAEWAGEYEIVDATFEILEGEYIAEAKNLTSVLGTDELINYQNQLVAFNNIIVEEIEYKNGEPGDDIYVTISHEGNSYNFCVERYLTGPETEVYQNVGALRAGDIVDVEGFLYWYNGVNTHITKVTVVSCAEEAESGKLAVQRNKISAGYFHSVGLKSDGTVVAAGRNDCGQCNVSDWHDIVAISAGGVHTVGLKSDGTVVAVGSNDRGQCDVSGWRDIVAISASEEHTVGLKADGTVVAAGENGADVGQCHVSGWRDIVAVSAGDNHTVGLKADGTVVAVGFYDLSMSNWCDIVAISAGNGNTVALKEDGSVVALGEKTSSNKCDVSNWRDIAAISAGSAHTVGLKSDGTVVAVGRNTYGQCNVSNWRDIVAISAGLYYTVGMKSDGTVIVAGEPQYNTSSGIIQHYKVSNWDLLK